MWFILSRPSTSILRSDVHQQCLNLSLAVWDPLCSVLQGSVENSCIFSRPTCQHVTSQCTRERWRLSESLVGTWCLYLHCTGARWYYRPKHKLCVRYSTSPCMLELHMFTVTSHTSTLVTAVLVTWFTFYLQCFAHFSWEDDRLFVRLKCAF